MGMACGDDDNGTDPLPTSPGGFETATPGNGFETPTNGFETPTIDDGANGDVVQRFNDLRVRFEMASAETQAELQSMWNEAEDKVGELMTATADERDELEDELDDLVSRIEERLDESS